MSELAQLVDRKVEILLGSSKMAAASRAPISGLLRSAAQLHRRARSAAVARRRAGLRSIRSRAESDACRSSALEAPRRFGEVLALGHERDEGSAETAQTAMKSCVFSRRARARGELDRRPVVGRVPDDERGRVGDCKRGSPLAEAQRAPRMRAGADEDVNGMGRDGGRAEQRPATQNQYERQFGSRGRATRSPAAGATRRGPVARRRGCPRNRRATTFGRARSNESVVTRPAEAEG